MQTTAILSFTKAKRAQNVDDFETWILGGVAPTLNAMDNNGEAFATVLIIDGTRVNDVRVYEDGIVPTVISRYGTGGGNVPMIFPIQDGREIEKNQNGLGIAEDGAPSYTLDRTGGQSVAIPIQGTVIGRADTSGPQGKGFSEDGSPMFTLTSTDVHAVAVDFYNASLSEYSQTLRAHSATAVNIGGVITNEPVAYDEFNNSISDVHHTLRAGTKQSTGVLDSVVRRLTPTECERLQGFPDGWTDGQADSNRYKQMGNAVAVPVVEWIISRMVGDE